MSTGTVDLDIQDSQFAVISAPDRDDPEQTSELTLTEDQLEMMRDKGSTHTITCRVAVGDDGVSVYDTRVVNIFTPSKL